MGAAYWIAKGMPAHKAIDKVRQTNPGAIEEHEQEESLYELVSILMHLGKSPQTYGGKSETIN